MKKESKLKRLRAELRQDFKIYLQVALEYDNKTISRSQLEMADFLQSGEPTLALFAPRGASKTEVSSIHYPAWRLLIQPELRVLIVSGVSGFADKICRRLHENFYRYPWLNHLAPPKGGGKTAFNLKGVSVEQSLSIEGTGVYSSVTGNRSDLQIFDDLQQENAVTEKTYDMIMARVTEYPKLLRDPTTRPWWNPDSPYADFQLTNKVIVGTYQSMDYDIYTPPSDDTVVHWMRDTPTKTWPAIIRDDNCGQVVVTRDGRPDIKYDGKYRSNFPEILPFNFLMTKKNELPEADWAMSYLLDKTKVPVDSYQIINLAKVLTNMYRYESEIKDINNWFMVIDPAEKGGDGFCAIECAPWQGKLYVRACHNWFRQDSMLSSKLVLDKCKKAGDIRKIYYESQFSSYGSVLKAALISENMRGLAIEEYRSTDRKLDRCVRTLEPALNGGKIRLCIKLHGHKELMEQMKGLRQGSLPDGNDDCIDCLSNAYRIFQPKLATAFKGSRSGVVIA